MSLYPTRFTSSSSSSLLLLITRQYFFRPSIITSHANFKMTSRTTKDYSSVPTPSTCYADFCLVPIGTSSVSVAKEVASVQKLIKASGIKHTMHSAGTTLEGSWDEVMKVIGQAHSVVHEGGVVRVQTSMRVGTRTDKKQTAEEKVKRVQDLLDKDGE
ncbi:YkoF-like protein [Cladorrhinum sp. PSN259]|nr:YkoF-like protein [Cladorrhinum sp. PSN259]